MTFEEVLTQIVEALQREKRISYRALKRRFALDDTYLDDLKEELIYAKRLALDEDSRVLVWAGGAEEPLLPARPAPSPVPPHIPLAAHATHTDAPPPPPQPPDAERRQLTVLFCDLVDSTALAGRLDPEDLRDVVRAYQQACATVIQRFEGHIAQYLGDGLLVYFGYPQAHEDDAQRAVQTGLGIVEAMGTLNMGLEQAQGLRLAVRVGIHTGLVVIGEMGGTGRQEGPSGPAPTQSRQQLALGETPNIAARLQGLAQPDTVVISDRTARLVEGYFSCQPLGAQELKGLAQPLQVYRVLHASAVQTRLDVAATRGLTPLVGRASEVALLQERWAQVKDGMGQVVVLSGEAGIGKSRLVQVLKEHVAGEAHTRWECRCSPYYQHTALYPVIDLLQRALRWQPENTAEAKVAKLEQMLRQYGLPLEETMPLCAALLSVPLPEDRYPPLALSPQRHKQKTLEIFLAILLEQATAHPTLLIMEDLHWVDPTTIEWLSLVVDQVPTTSVCLLVTCRPEFQSPWGSRSYLTQMTLNRLPRIQVAQMVELLADRVTGGQPFPAEVMQHLVEKSDGIPLFVEEMTKTVLESATLTAGEREYVRTGPVSAVAIPATLQDSLMARLDRLVTAKGLAQLGATLGRQFSYALLQAVAQLDEETLRRELQRLVAAELLYQRGVPPQATYLFKHALIQDVAYQSLLKSTRQHYHQRIAQVLEARFPEAVATQPELLAHHYTAAGCTGQAVRYWQRAGEQASDCSANLEAISHFTAGIELLKTLPETPEHIQQALSLHTALGAALQMAKGTGAPEVEHAYTQARALCQQVGETPELVPVLFGLWRFYHSQAQFHTARELGDTLLRLAQRAEDPVLAVVAHNALGNTWLCLGALPAARQHLEAGIARYTPDHHRAPASRIGHDPGVACRAFAAWVLWVLGYPEQALTRVHEALALAYELSHPFSLAYARCWAAMVSQFRRDVSAVHEHAEAAVALSTEQGFASWAAYGTSLRGWAIAMQGQGEVGIAQVRQGITTLRAAGGAVLVPYLCTVLADVCDHLGHPEDGLQALAEAHALVEQHEERWWEAEVYRLRGVLLLRQAGTQQAEAETWLQRALDVARSQQAKSLELRAAVSLVRLWQRHGKRTAAYELLAPVYNWFTEGFDTADLQEAKALLAALT
jgi:predicted ATPase/class 3 adenylate cyclase